MKRALAIAALLYGCATETNFMWLHPNPNQAQFDKDIAQCNYESATATASYAPTGSYLADQVYRNERRIEIGTACMKLRGYTRTPLRR